MPSIIAAFKPSDIYNADETGLFYKAKPDKTLHFSGGKMSKDRLTIMFACNADGSDKRKPLVIGKSAKPRCLKGINLNNLKVEYRGNSSAWMTAQIFTEWIMKFDSDMKRQKRNVLMFLDNFRGHDIDQSKLTNRMIKFFPPNPTSVLQPLDQGIIQSFKVRYRKLMVSELVEQIESGGSYSEYDVRIALDKIGQSWNSVTPKTIRNCFKHSGFTLVNDDNNEEHDLDIDLDDVWQRFCAIDVSDTHSLIYFKDYVYIDHAVTTYQQDTDEDIISSVTKPSQTEDDEVSFTEEEPLVIPTLNEAKKALSVVKLFLESRDFNTNASLASVSTLEKALDSFSNLKQAKISNYFTFEN